MVLHPLEKLEAVMLGHEQVHDSKVIAVRRELGLRFLDSCNAFGSEPATFDQTLENTPDALLIIDYQYATIHTYTAYTITSGASNALPERFWKSIRFGSGNAQGALPRADKPGEEQVGGTRHPVFAAVPDDGPV